MMKDQKGITLVALIITIIVMLILVAVTISIALQGGLFDKARSASDGTRIAQVKEAMALAKSDYYAKYYDPTDAFYMSTTAPTAAQMKAAIEQYLETDKIAVTVAEPVKGATGTTYTITIDQAVVQNTNVALSNSENTILLDMWKTTQAASN